MNDDALFCPKCGTKVVKPVAPSQPSIPVQQVNVQQMPVYAQPMNANIVTQPQGTAAKGNGGKIAIIVIVAVVLIAAVIGGCVLLFGNVGSGDLFSSEPKMWDIIPEIDYTDVDDFEYHYGDIADLSEKYSGIIIDGYKRHDKSVRIPDTIDGEPVIGVFLYDYDLTEIVVPETVRRFIFNKQTVKYINYPRDSLRNRDDSYEIYAVEAVYISNELTEIPDGAFWYYGNLKEIHIPKSVTKIGRGAFMRCIELEKVNIPNNVTVIEVGAFAQCFNLKTVTLPNDLRKCAVNAFDIQTIIYKGKEYDVSDFRDVCYELEKKYKDD